MARDDIADLVHRYAEAVVHYDGEQWAATWAPDAVWELGPGRRMEGRDEIVESWHAALARFRAVVQTVSNGTCSVDEAAGTGSGRWYIQEHYERGDGVRGKLLAHYDDEYIRIEGAWVFASRVLTIHYHGAQDLSGDFLTVH